MTGEWIFLSMIKKKKRDLWKKTQGSGCNQNADELVISADQG